MDWATSILLGCILSALIGIYSKLQEIRDELAFADTEKMLKELKEKQKRA